MLVLFTCVSMSKTFSCNFSTSYQIPAWFDRTVCETYKDIKEFNHKHLGKQALSALLMELSASVFFTIDVTENVFRCTQAMVWSAFFQHYGQPNQSLQLCLSLLTSSCMHFPILFMLSCPHNCTEVSMSKRGKQSCQQNKCFKLCFQRTSTLYHI